MATLRDVAEYAGVSVMTVSRVVNRTGKVSPKRVKRVMEAVETLGYQPNLLARSMITKSAKIIGVLYSNIYNPIYADQIAGIESIAQEAGYSILLANIYDYDSVVSNFSTLVSMQVDGIIVLPIELRGVAEEERGAEMLRELNRVKEYIHHYFQRTDAKPGVVAGENFLGDQLSCAEFNYSQGARAAMKHLFSCGYTDILYMTSFWEERGVWSERQESYFDEMRSHGCEEKIRVERTEDSAEGGYRCMRRILASGRVPQAVLCGNDSIAVGAIQAAGEMNVQVPSQLAIMGQDGLSIGDMIFPKLSTVAINGIECGRVATQMLLERIACPETPLKHVKIDQEVCLRQSTAGERDTATETEG